MPHALIRTWAEDGFKLELFDTFTTDRYGKAVLAYRMSHLGDTIFEGADFHCSPLHATNSDNTVAGLLGFLSLRPGDTNDEWFTTYTPEQLAWCLAHGEYLAGLALDLEALHGEP